MKILRRQAGFSLLTAIFLLTVLASLGAFVIVLSGVSHQTPVLGLNGARAYHAARSGLEWGIERAVTGAAGGCNGTFAVDGFTVVVTCASTPHKDGNTDIAIYTIQSVATRGNPGELGYARRELHATASPFGPL
ncbi:MAG: pilus assembly protein MshP [Proteobacteria bacterium]|nr:pilus assembly protein MshP [Pseudomonadota bacterium]